MRGCVGAIDGIAIQIIKPSAWDTIQPQMFKNRKKFYSVNCQAICDSDMRFLWVSMRSPGGTHDSLAWGCTDLCAYLSENGIGEGFYLVGDDAYAGTPWMFTHYPLQNLTTMRSDFNFYQSRCRINIECAFGLLVQRFVILRRPLTCSVRHSCVVVKACM